MVFGLLAVNEIFIKLFLGESFQDVKYVIYIITINIMFIGWTNILGFQVLVVRDKKQRVYVIYNNTSGGQCSR